MSNSDTITIEHQPLLYTPNYFIAPKQCNVVYGKGARSDKILVDTMRQQFLAASGDGFNLDLICLPALEKEYRMATRTVTLVRLRKNAINDKAQDKVRHVNTCVGHH